jgi:hypothetical protein
MLLEVKNIKLSCKAKTTQSLDYIAERSAELGFRYRRFGNFVQLYAATSSLRLSFFKVRSLSLSGRQHQLQHINITGVATPAEQDKAIRHIINILGCTQSDLTIKVDNITAHGKIPISTPLVLESCIAYFERADLKWRLNRETFSGICIYSDCCTGILYAGGSLVVVGGKQINDCQWLADTIECIIRKVAPTM